MFYVTSSFHKLNEYGNLEPPQYFCLSLVDYIKVPWHYHLIWSTFLEVPFKAIQIKHVLLKHLLPQTSEACTFTSVFFRLDASNPLTDFYLMCITEQLFLKFFKYATFSYDLNVLWGRNHPHGVQICTGLHDWSSFKAQAVQECFGLPHREIHLFSICSTQTTTKSQQTTSITLITHSLPCCASHTKWEALEDDGGSFQM